MTTEKVEQDIRFIKKVLEDNRRILIDNGVFYILWGAMTVLGTAISYIFINQNMLYILPFFWPAFIILFIFIQKFLDRKTEPNEHISSFGWKLFNAVWQSVGITGVLLTTLFFTTSVIPLPVFLGSIAAVFGIAYYLSGIINDLKFLTYLSFAWWAATIILVLWEQFINLYYIAMFFAGLILFLQVIPGIIIYKKWKRDYA
jgi:hypothetical protein